MYCCSIRQARSGIEATVQIKYYNTFHGASAVTSKAQGLNLNKIFHFMLFKIKTMYNFYVYRHLKL